ncbi:transcription factor BHLH6-like [Lolium rigidum]|uniref:transcription factor BHLH6-like n=1 Tax=Lolium rigidum TaxID=89674 RepID=UPI001F5CABD6|nr:transcription factor BHLH6-like [Lolium rigidum]
MELTEVGENLAMVSVKHNKMRDATATVCRALESLCLEVITANITTIAGGIIHTMFVEMKEWEGEKNRMFHEMGFSSETTLMQDDKV